MNGIPPDPLSPLHWIDRLLKNGERIDKATTGAIVAAAGPAAVLGWFSGGLAWMPFAAFICILLYRSWKYYQEREDRKLRAYIALQGQVRGELEAINRSALPDSQKQELAIYLTEANAQSAKRTRLLRS
jgi:hypothetical protein